MSSLSQYCPGNFGHLALPARFFPEKRSGRAEKRSLATTLTIWGASPLPSRGCCTKANLFRTVLSLSAHGTQHSRDWPAPVPTRDWRTSMSILSLTLPQSLQEQV